MQIETRNELDEPIDTLTKKSGKRKTITRLITISVLLLLCCAVGIWGAKQGRGIFVEATEIPKVLDLFMMSMENQDIEKAISLFEDPSDERRAVLLKSSEGVNRSLYDGYQELEITAWNLNYENNNGEADIAGNVMYMGEFTGRIEGSLVTVNGQWKITDIVVYVPPTKVQEYIQENCLETTCP